MISYGPPIRRFDKKNPPSEADFDLVEPVGVCVADTTAPETLTTPLIEEVVETSAKVDVENTNKADNTAAYIFLDIVSLLIR